MIYEIRSREWSKLAIGIVCIGLFWLVALPAVGRFPSVSEHVANQKHLGIDPSAMFYTELEISPMIANHVEKLHDVHSDKFWQLSAQKP